MKKITVKTRVFNYLSSNEFLLLNRKPKLDMRYNESKEFIKLLNFELKKFNKKMALDKIRLRREKYVFENVLNNKIYLDYKKHYSDIKYIHQDFIQFYGRNHHAKNIFDLRVIEILRLNFNNKKSLN